MTDKKNILIGALIFAICVMSIGYAAFATTLKVTGTATISNDWDVEITNIAFVPKTDGTAATKSEGEAASTSATHTMTTASFAATLYQPGDVAVYDVTIENKGSTNATLSGTPGFVVNTTSPNHDYNVIKWEVVTAPASSLNAGATTHMIVKVYYDSTITDAQWTADQTAASPNAIVEEATVQVEYQQAS